MYGKQRPSIQNIQEIVIQVNVLGAKIIIKGDNLQNNVSY